MVGWQAECRALDEAGGAAKYDTTTAYADVLARASTQTVAEGVSIHEAISVLSEMQDDDDDEE
jgi:hypothetical protein